MGRALLTDRQREIYNFIVDFFFANLRMPVLREIGAAMGITTPNGVRVNLMALVKKGWLERRQVSGSGYGSYHIVGIRVLLIDDDGQVIRSSFNE